MEVIGKPEFHYLDEWVNTFDNIVYVCKYVYIYLYVYVHIGKKKKTVLLIFFFFPAIILCHLDRLGTTSLAVSFWSLAWLCVPTFWPLASPSRQSAPWEVIWPSLTTSCSTAALYTQPGTWGTLCAILQRFSLPQVGSCVIAQYWTLLKEK